MEHLDIKNTKVPVLGLGTYRLYGAECTNVVQEALDIGYRHIDTAQYYENEFQIGDALKASPIPREDIFLTTKISSKNMNFGHATQSVENSLRRLGTDYVDLLLLHSPPDVPTPDVLEELVKMRTAGKVKAMGLSNYYGALFTHIVQDFDFDLITNQIEWSPYVDVVNIRKAIIDADMFVTAYCPLGRGRAIHDATIIALAEKHQKTNAQITLRWLVQHGKTSVIPKTSSPLRLQENMDIFNFTLPAEDMAALSGLPKNGRVIEGNFLEGKVA